MPEPTDKQFFYFFLFALTSAGAIHFHAYGFATFYAFAAWAVKEGW